MKFNVKELIFETDEDKKIFLEKLHGFSKIQNFEKKEKNSYTRLEIIKVIKGSYTIYRGFYFVTNKKIEEFSMVEEKGFFNSLKNYMKKSKQNGLLEYKRFFQFYSIVTIDNRVFFHYDVNMVGGLTHKSLFIFLKTLDNEINISSYETKLSKNIDKYLKKNSSRIVKEIELQLNPIDESKKEEIRSNFWLKRFIGLKEDLDINPRLSFLVKNLELKKVLENLKLEDNFGNNIDIYNALYIRFDGTKKKVNLSNFIYQNELSIDKINYIEEKLNDSSEESIYNKINNLFMESYEKDDF